MYIILTTSGSSKKISIGFRGYTIEGFLKKLGNATNIIGKKLRYIELDKGCEQTFYSMDIITFEKMFVDMNHCKLNKNQVDYNFNKKIQKEYGTISKFKNIKRISKKDLIVGNVYKDENDEDILYCGQVEVEEHSTYKYGENEKGILFVKIYNIQNFNLVGNKDAIISDGRSQYKQVKKTNSVRLMIDTGIHFTLPHTLSGSNSSGNFHTKIIFFDV